MSFTARYVDNSKQLVVGKACITCSSFKLTRNGELKLSASFAIFSSEDARDAYLVNHAVTPLREFQKDKILTEDEVSTFNGFASVDKILMPDILAASIAPDESEDELQNAVNSLVAEHQNLVSLIVALENAISQLSAASAGLPKPSDEANAIMGFNIAEKQKSIIQEVDARQKLLAEKLLLKAQVEEDVKAYKKKLDFYRSEWRLENITL